MTFLFSFIFLVNCTAQVSDETARSGSMSIAVTQQLWDITKIQTETFSSYYPEAHITTVTASSKNAVSLLLDHGTRAAIIDGEPDGAEKLLISKQQRTLRQEAIARDAIICLVNTKNSAKRISFEELDTLFMGKGQNSAFLLIEDDRRLQAIFAAKLGKRLSDLHASTCATTSEVVRQVSLHNNAIALLFLSSLTTRPVNTKILPVSIKSSSSEAYLPIQQTMFDGRYPLVTTVYYVYFAGDALASGFGAWLGSSGQKTFERSSFAPYRLVEKTIILK